MTAAPALRLWLLGAGIAESPGPAMQNAALRAAGISGEYVAIDCDAAGARLAVERLRAGEAAGANVTMPHKRLAAGACDRLEEDALLCAAVNTLVVENGRLVGANTDARGLEGALREAGLWPSGGAAAVIGAGGAAAAAVLAMTRAGCTPVQLVARRPERAAAIAALHPAAARVEVVALDDARVTALLRTAAVVINATPAGVDALPAGCRNLDPATVVCDLRYRPRPVDLVAVARAGGLRAVDGVGMLLHQGMLSFQRWTGVAPPWDAARAALLAALEDGSA